MANSYLSRTPGSAGNTKKFTFSAWVKRSKIGADQYILHAYPGSGQRSQILFKAADTMQIDLEAGNTNKLVTTRVFRDTSSFYHIVVVYDSDNATSGDRVILYVNGVRETEFGTEQYPNAGSTSQINTTTQHEISTYDGSSGFFEGYMSHVSLVDGSVVAPTVFGQTDSTTGKWKFKNPTGVTWGTNGFHLKFENSGNLGLDSSGNSNTWTVNGDLKQALDTPSNVHATMNPLINNGTTTTYSQGNNTVSTSNAHYKVSASTLAVSTGKWYMEFKAVSGSFGSVDAAVGIIQTETAFSTSSQNLNAYPNGYSYGSHGQVKQYNNSNIYTGSTYTDGDIIGIALDMDNNKLYFRKNDNAWENSGDPTSGSTGTGAVSITSGKEYYFACSTITSGGTKVFSANFGNGLFGTTAITSAGSNGNGSLFEFDCPSGYYALNTNNINTYG